MKKRLIAGALALLMIIGLLPVSSMLKKPVEAQAATPSIYELSNLSVKSYKANDYLDAKKYFQYVNKDASATLDIDNQSWAGGTAIKIDSNNKKIKIHVSGSSAEISVTWITDKEAGKCTLSVAGKEEKNTATKTAQTTTQTVSAAGDYEIYRSAGSTLRIQSIIVVETGDDSTVDPTPDPDPTVTSYTVTVKDGSNETPYTDLTEGAQQTITAKGNDFAYWVNSNGRIVSIDKEYKFNVYYSDTYTAVYNDTTSKKVVFMTAYGQEYETVPYVEGSFSEKDIPAVPARLGYTSNGWDKDTDAINAALKSSDYVKVNPNYETDTQLTYGVKISKNAVGETYIVNGKTYSAGEYVEFPVNTIITVKMVNPDGYNCWVDNSTSDILSYNDTYTFFVNRKIQIEVKNRKVSEKLGVITLVSATNNSDGNKEIVYEFTVPDGYSIEFAGVLGDTTEANVNDKAAKYVGGRASSATTFRYTLTIDSRLVDNLYIMPILKYKKGTELKTIMGTVQKASAV